MKAAVYPNIKRDENLDCTKKIADFLIINNCQVNLNEKYKHVINDSRINFCSDILSGADFAITIGGDGTILKIAVDAAKNKIPLIGINLGHVGYMTELETNETDLIANILSGKYSIDKRMLLSIEIKRGEEIIAEYSALNDAVISNGTVAKMLSVDILRDNNIINSINADGVVISTPTGSTAYSLSAGGPFIEPELECISVVPICPHTIFSRAIMFSKEKTVSIRIGEKSYEEADVYLTVDGMINHQLHKGDEIICKKSALSVELIRIKNNSFFDILKEKMLKRSM